MRRLLLAAPILLAACEGGSEGGNNSDGNGTAQATVLEQVPENLMDDPGNESVPVKPPLPTPTNPPGPLAAPKPMSLGRP